ncbi:enoyl-CoA hydratase/isomerase family protein [Desulfospira joergensenii]|uniref:enoyl-CoA hydratase/isomerase family protein n=1 Tax=Desulfospira joergensenii TaxID=53329 RepID=UPI0003B61A5F|nr:enoyl-CoA hydratase/isomerase family protein [Desulfospira joergensenii]
MLVKENQDNILILKLTDGRTNAIDLNTLRQLDKAVQEVNDDPALKGLVLTGEGRFFSSGFSLPMFINFTTREEVIDFFTEQENILVNFFTCTKPVVTAMNGHSAAMGMILAMASDYRIVKNHPKIKLGMSEIKIGLGLSIAQTAVMRFGLDSDKKYRDVMYFGEMMDVNRARELQIVDEVVEEENLLSRAGEIISLWIDTPNRPFIQIKHMLKKDTAEKIRQELQQEDWKSGMCDTLLNPEVRATLEFVQAAMEGKK